MAMDQSSPEEAVHIQKSGMVNNGGTQYSLAAAADVAETTEKDIADNNEDLKSLPSAMKD